MADEGKKRKGKRKGLGGLSPEKKRMLKTLIMQKAAEDLKKQQEKAAEAKRKIIEGRVPKLAIDGLNEDQLRQVVKALHAKVNGLEEEKYDWEVKMRKQDFEINEISLKVNEAKGKFVKPVLKKVSKTESKLAKLEREAMKKKLGFRDNLKSTGQDKYAIESKEEPKDKPGWAGGQAKKSEEEAPAGEEEEEEEEEE